ncbi:hypothetical protein AVEN_193750-1 [Araneus ventricosus]|uniref:Uncharacterized protein n=1 Tax=Araneus ventricosus TaxID=182803 RepID=A0A4Y2DKU8_ARAVE|nr:hypothetical protein AVEN_193750-1 [Araneus ventricosus]
MFHCESAFEKFFPSKYPVLGYLPRPWVNTRYIPKKYLPTHWAFTQPTSLVKIAAVMNATSCSEIRISLPIALIDLRCTQIRPLHVKNRSSVRKGDENLRGEPESLDVQPL